LVEEVIVTAQKRGADTGRANIGLGLQGASYGAIAQSPGKHGKTLKKQREPLKRSLSLNTRTRIASSECSDLNV
jgi:hypothetical protein